VTKGDHPALQVGGKPGASPKPGKREAITSQRRKKKDNKKKAIIGSS